MKDVNQTVGFIDFTRQKVDDTKSICRSNQSNSNSREITPASTKPYFTMTGVEKSKLKSLEEDMQSKIESGQILNTDLLSLVS